MTRLLIPTAGLVMPVAGRAVLGFVPGAVAPCTWSVAAGQLRPGLGPVSAAAPTDDNQPAGPPATADTFVFTMKATDGADRQATRQFSLTILK